MMKGRDDLFDHANNSVDYVVLYLHGRFKTIISLAIC